jgi:hypothetical protein
MGAGRRLKLNGFTGLQGHFGSEACLPRNYTKTSPYYETKKDDPTIKILL